MSNKPSRPRARSAPSTGAPAPAPEPKRKLLWLWVSLAVIVLAAGIIAVVSGGDEKELTVGSVPASGAPVVSAAPGNTIGPSKGEVWPVTVTGTPLAQLPSDGSADPAIGQAAPVLSGYTFDGSPVTYDVADGPVMMVFIAHWCPHCNREVPELIKWNADGKVPTGLQVIGVTTAVNPAYPNYPPSSWIESFKWPWPVLADSENQDAAIAMGLSGYPFVVIVGTDGKVITRWSGEKGEDGIQSLVDAALA
ncbi:MAG: hypothetical protein JWN99_671 [Ilumatobacteraceae bacterium]|nr:hypothetical protein [Ilumatobacteraceae bacterium]